MSKVEIKPTARHATAQPTCRFAFTGMIGQSFGNFRQAHTQYLELHHVEQNGSLYTERPRCELCRLEERQQVQQAAQALAIQQSKAVQDFEEQRKARVARIMQAGGFRAE